MKRYKADTFRHSSMHENHGRLIITEGQIDSLSVADCQIENTVSVPTGQGGRTWVQHCYDFVNGFDEIIVFGDHENGHVTLVDQITASFPAKKSKWYVPKITLEKRTQMLFIASMAQL